MKPPRGEPAFRMPEQPPMQLAEALTDEELEAATRPEPVATDLRPWIPMDDAPRDGAVLEVKVAANDPDERVLYAMWRTTRQRNATLRQWVVISMWVNPLTYQPLGFEPEVWRRPEGFSLPGTRM